MPHNVLYYKGYTLHRNDTWICNSSSSVNEINIGFVRCETKINIHIDIFTKSCAKWDKTPMGLCSHIHVLPFASLHFALLRPLQMFVY